MNQAHCSFFVVLTLWLSAGFAFSLELSFRRGTASDVMLARKIMLQEAMNPLSISQDRLLVAFDKDIEKEVLGFGQIRRLDDFFSELASLYVMPDRRRKGIGGGLIKELLERHDEKESKFSTQRHVCLLTLRPTAGLYEKYGFETIEEEEMKAHLPSSVQFEYKAGGILSALLGNDLICMIRR